VEPVVSITRSPWRAGRRTPLRPFATADPLRGRLRGRRSIWAVRGDAARRAL